MSEAQVGLTASSMAPLLSNIASQKPVFVISRLEFCGWNFAVPTVIFFEGWRLGSKSFPLQAAI